MVTLPDDPDKFLLKDRTCPYSGKSEKRKSPHFSIEAVGESLFFKRVQPVFYSLLSSPLNTRETLFLKSKKNTTLTSKIKKSLIPLVSGYITKWESFLPPS